MTTLRFDLVVALDRSDATAAVAVFQPSTGLLTHSEVFLAPEALESWWSQLRAKHPDARIAVAFEQPAPNLPAFFAARPPAAILALNPSAIWAYRQSLTVSRARTDASDARDIARFVARHADELTPWHAPDSALRQLDCLGQARRKRVDQRASKALSCRKSVSCSTTRLGKRPFVSNSRASRVTLCVHCRRDHKVPYRYMDGPSDAATLSLPPIRSINNAPALQKETIF